MDKLQWFKFRPSDWIMGRISKTNKTTQAEFLNFCCTYWNKQCDMTTTQTQFEMSKAVWKKLTELEIIKVDGEQIHIEFLDEQMVSIDDMRQKASLAGKASAKKRNESQRTSTNVQRNPTEKRREEKSIYRTFAHLSITNDEFEKLCLEYSTEIVNFTLDQIENYKANKNYKNLYLTCKSWLRKEPKKANDNKLYNHVMKQIKK